MSDRVFNRASLARYLSGISGMARKCIAEHCIRIPNERTVEFTGDLYLSNEEVRAFGGGAVYEETYITIEREGKRKAATFNIADLLWMFGGKRVKITVEVLE